MKLLIIEDNKDMEFIMNRLEEDFCIFDLNKDCNNCGECL